MYPSPMYKGIWLRRASPRLGASLVQSTRFTFTIPVAEEAGSAAPGDALNRPVARHKGHERIRILVVDDDPQTLRYVRDALEEAGYSPMITGDHENLARIIQTEKPQLVLLDLMLSGADGIELMKTVPALADLPVIFISGYGRDEDRARLHQNDPPESRG